MDPPPAAPPLTTTAAADSVDSSPRSRHTNSSEDSYQTVPGTTVPKLRLMCSFGGHIVPRPHDKSLCYIGGDTRIIVVDRQSSLSDLTSRLSKTLFNNNPNFSLKYQLPNEDLDSLISVTTDEDLENMIDEYDRLNNNNTAGKFCRLRLFLFPLKPESGSSIGSLLNNSTKSEDWFLSALNGTTGGGLSDSNSVNCLLGLDDDIAIANNNNINNNNNKPNNASNPKNQDVHSVPDSPMLETTSSFGSANSSPSLGNLPPIRLQVEDQKHMGIEEQFSQMGVTGNGNQKSDEGGFVGLASPPPAAATVVVAAALGVPMSSAPVMVGDYSNRVFSEDEKSEQGGGVAMGYRKQLQQQQQMQQSVTSQLPQKTTGGGLDLASPDSVSSEGSITNPLSRQKPIVYQDPNVQIQPVRSRVSASPVEPKITDPSSRVQMQQQFQDSGYLMSTQYDPQHHPQLHQQQPQLIHAGAQYIQHHPPGAMPMASYYPIYPSQQSHHPHHPALDQQQYPVYYVPARQPQAYNMAAQPQGYSEAASTTPSSQPQTPPSAMGSTPSAAYNNARNAPVPNSEMPTGVYRTATTSAPALVQVPSSQHQQPQYVGFSQIHHPSQSIAPTLGTTAKYAYEYADSQAQMYYTQPLPPQMAAQYQTMKSALPEAAAHLPTDGIQQQVRTLQP